MPRVRASDQYQPYLNNTTLLFKLIFSSFFPSDFKTIMRYLYHQYADFSSLKEYR